ncbi:MAG: signal peptidase II [Actinomycetota bacterium]
MANGDAEANTGGPGSEAPRGRLVRVFAAVLVLVALDQAAKIWAVAALADGPIHIIGDTVELTLARNPGGAFGRFQGLTPLLALGAIIVTVILVRASHRATDIWTLVGLVLLLGGATGNLGDRIFRSPGVFRGHVVDFVSVGWWPVFNVADSCISIGAVVLILRSLRAPHAVQSAR